MDNPQTVQGAIREDKAEVLLRRVQGRGADKGL